MKTITAIVVFLGFVALFLNAASRGYSKNPTCKYYDYEMQCINEYWDAKDKADRQPDQYDPE